MSNKKLSVADFITIVTAISVAITAVTQAYFYFRLDALWLMPLINPSIYFLEVVKVFLFLLIIILATFALEELYAYIIRKTRVKHKLRLSEISTQELSKALINNRKLYERNFLWFYLVVIVILSFVFIVLNPIIFITNPFVFGMIIGGVLGCILIIFLEKSLAKVLRFGILGIAIILISIFNAEMKFGQLRDAPYVYVKGELNEKYRVVEITQDQVIALNDKSKNLEIRLIKADQIKKIVAEVRPNQ